MHIVIVTGMSGSGKSVALRQLEDIGYFCVDNLPLDFVFDVAQRLKKTQERIAFAVDSRSGISRGTTPAETIARLEKAGWRVDVLFLTAATPTLIRRFSETRRRHPLSKADGAESDVTLTEAIARERELLSGFSEAAAQCDTSGLSSNDLRDWVTKFARTEHSQMSVAFESFAFKRGIPFVADLVFDARCLPNPYYDEALRPFTGLDEPIRAFMRETPGAEAFLADIAGFIERWLAAYSANNRRYFTVAVGCTGGQHRSVYIAQRLFEIFSEKLPAVSVRHRELAKKDRES